MDVENPVIRLCADGMGAEAAGETERAVRLFDQAWQRANDDYEACVAAHYLARHQPTPRARLHWNSVCLDRADAVGDERVAAFYPSLHANLGRCHRELGDDTSAARHFRLAAEHLATLPPGPYADWLRYAVAEGLRDTGAVVRTTGEHRVAAVLAQLCDCRDLRSLALLLPAYVGHVGTAADHERLALAARQLHAEARLSDPAREQLEDAIDVLSGSPGSRRDHTSPDRRNI
ncbi:hypothetical protein B1813_21955 [Saccharomonospora piscinae]|uniref:Tetratricopeptide repeat protein n=1 Tax=Saccharomonospora piscinae TaxID=687388 RepID=A0A1V8ZXB0_SACPI|nr:hypothetical protein [Saccharomonospora piscinae]OQO89587.1 hypothetical protein B1813_21955 [Saccharomonospora piscinae]